jgi:1-acyl-sn-glycerol-3-phosphate acyltransferase
MDAILLYCLKTQFRLLADDLYFLIPGLGWALTAAGHIKIDGGNLLRRQSGLERAKKHLLKGIPVLVFPEGKCTQDAGTAKFNESFLRIAIECDCPIVPITLHNTEKLLGRPPVTPQVTRVVVQIHQQIETRGLKSHALTEQVRRIIETKLGELSTETASYC